MASKNKTKAETSEESVYRPEEGDKNPNPPAKPAGKPVEKEVSEHGKKIGEAMEKTVASSVAALADVFSSTEDLDGGQIAQKLLTPLADLAITAGTIILCAGLGIEALKESMKNFGGPWAIVAGAALIALGVAAKAGLAAAAGGGKPAAHAPVTTFTGSGGATAPTTTSKGYAIAPVGEMQMQVVEVTGRLSGQDIVLASNNYQQNKAR